MHKEITIDTNMEYVIDDFNKYLCDELYRIVESGTNNYNLKTIDEDNIDIYYVLSNMCPLSNHILNYMEELIDNSSETMLNDIKLLILQQDPNVEVYDVANYTNLDNFNFNLYSNNDIKFNENIFKQEVIKLLDKVIANINLLINSEILNILFDEYKIDECLAPILQHNGQNYNKFLNYYLSSEIEEYDISKLMKSDLTISVENR